MTRGGDHARDHVLATPGADRSSRRNCTTLLAERKRPATAVDLKHMADGTRAAEVALPQAGRRRDALVPRCRRQPGRLLMCFTFRLGGVPPRERGPPCRPASIGGHRRGTTNKVDPPGLPVLTAGTYNAAPSTRRGLRHRRPFHPARLAAAGAHYRRLNFRPAGQALPDTGAGVTDATVVLSPSG